MSIFKRTQRKYVKKAYRVRNWREYEAGLRNRGSLTVWISLTAGKLVNWDAPRPRRRKPGRQRKYSNHAIETAVTLGMVFHLSSRQSEGLLRSLFALMKLDNDVPDHTTISRRKAKLGKVPFYQDKQKTPLHILFDSSGLAVHAGQLRRAPKSRDYRKLHLCVDEQSGEVVAGELTSKRARDSSRVASLVGQFDSPISSGRCCTALAESEIRLWWWPRYVSSMKYPKRCQYKHAKQKKYHVRNWAEYNEGLRRRGDLTVWFDEEAIANWKADKTGKPGGQRVYSDMAIETGLVVRMVYKLAYRQTEGFLHSIASLLGLGIEIPDYSTLCRRSRLLRKKLRIPKAASTQPIHLMIDSTGLRIHVGNARKPPK